MSEILQFIRPGECLDPAALEVLGAAYDKVVNGHTSKFRRDIIAGRLIEAGLRGERDLDTLCKLALRDE